MGRDIHHLFFFSLLPDVTKYCLYMVSLIVFCLDMAEKTISLFLGFEILQKTLELLHNIEEYNTLHSLYNT